MGRLKWTRGAVALTPFSAWWVIYWMLIILGFVSWSKHTKGFCGCGSTLINLFIHPPRSWRAEREVTQHLVKIETVPSLCPIWCADFFKASSFQISYGHDLSKGTCFISCPFFLSLTQNLVDLAGAERASQTGAEGKRRSRSCKLFMYSVYCYYLTAGLCCLFYFRGPFERGMQYQSQSLHLGTSHQKTVWWKPEVWLPLTQLNTWWCTDHKYIFKLFHKVKSYTSWYKPCTKRLWIE